MDPHPTLAFDVYGTLVDPIGIAEDLAAHLGVETAADVSEIWRRKQLEFTFRQAAMRTYQDFEWCTRRGLDHALAATGSRLTDGDKDALLARYSHLEVFPDTIPGLDALTSAGFALAVLSNGTPPMLGALLANTGLERYFSHCLSVDGLRTYKPDPAVYLHAAGELGREPAEVMLVSSNPFDVIGAQAAGLSAAWVDRAGGVFDADGSPPRLVVSNLGDLSDALTASR